ncbi:MAG TPA: tail fiber domain-containing protein [Patescibacteria group bacterium]|nr:tail fiber domain-containing protein [Patescibacteria group bacterium]
MKRVKKGLYEFFAITVLFAQGFIVSPAVAATFPAIPKQIGFHAKLLTSSGAVITGSPAVTFKIYNVSTGGSSLYSDTQNLTAPSSTCTFTPCYGTDGVFSAYIGAGSGGNINLPFDQPYYVEMVVGGETLTPRILIASVAFTYTASQSLGTVVATATPTGTVTAGSLYFNTTSNQLFVSDGTSWNSLGGSGTGTSVFTNLVQATAGLSVTGSMSVAGTSTSLGAATNFLVNSGVTVLQNTLSVSGLATLGSGFVAAGSSTVAGTFTVSGTTTLSSGILVANGVTYTLPVTQAAGVGYLLTNNGSGTLSWTAPGTCSTCIVQGGNAFAQSVVVGSNDAQSVLLETNNNTRLTIDSNGNFIFGSSTSAVAPTFTLVGTGAASFGGTLAVTNLSTFNSGIITIGSSTLVGSATVAGSLTTQNIFAQNIWGNNANFSGNGTVSGSFNAGSTTLTALSAGNTAVNTLNAATSTLANTTINGTLSSGTTSVTGPLGISGTTTAAGMSATYLTNSGATVLQSTLTAAGLASLNAGYIAAGSSTVIGNFTTTGSNTFANSNMSINGVYYNWTNTQSSGTKFLQNDGSGNLTWAAVPSGTSTPLTDNTNPAFSVYEGGNNYISISTLNGSENITFGTTSINQSFTFAGVGTTTFQGPLSLNNILNVTGAAVFSSLPALPLANGSLLVGSTTANAVPLAPGTNGQVLGISGGVPSWVTTPDATGITSLNGLTGATQTFANDTNVTLSSSGATHTIGWLGQLSVPRGGTGAASFTANGILLGNGTSALQSTLAPTAGQILIGNSSGVPIFASVFGDASLAASGTLTLANTGVSAGTFGSATVIPVITLDSKGRLTAVGTTAITSVAVGTQLNNTLRWNGSSWVESSLLQNDTTGITVNGTSTFSGLARLTSGFIASGSSTVTGSATVAGLVLSDQNANSIPWALYEAPSGGLIFDYVGQQAKLTAAGLLFTKGIISTGSSTMVGDTTITGTTTLPSGVLAIRGVSYYFPVSGGSSGQFLQTDGSGQLNWAPAITSGYLSQLNGLTVATQSFAVGSLGSDFNISSVGGTHTFNLPDAGTASRGVVTTSAQQFAGNKTFTGSATVVGAFNASTANLAAANISGNTTLGGTLNSGNRTVVSAVGQVSAVQFDVTGDGANYNFDYDLNGSSDAADPTITLVRGQTYKFNVNASGHPFQIRVSDGGAAYNTGVTNNGADTSTVTFQVPFDAPNELVYQCTSHAGMVGKLRIVNQSILTDADGNTNVLVEQSANDDTIRFVTAGSERASIGSSGGLALANLVPGVTTNVLYNNNGTLYFNGAAVGGSGGNTSQFGTTTTGLYTLSNLSVGTAVTSGALLTVATGTTTGLQVLSSGLVTLNTGFIATGSSTHTGTTTVSNALTRLIGQTLTTQTTNSVGALQVSGSIAKNDATTKSFSIMSLNPTLNTGASNANTTFTVLDINTTNTSVTGIDNPSYLINAKYGGAARFTVGTDGTVFANSTVAAPIFYDSNGLFQLSSNATDALTFASSGDITWTSTADIFGAKDLSVTRAAAGMLRISDASTGAGKLHIGGSGNLNANALLNVGTGSLPTLFVGVNDSVGMGSATPFARLGIVGTSLSTQPTNAVGAVAVGGSVTKNDATNKAYNAVLIKPTLNTGASNNNLDFTVLNIDTVNTNTTGVSTSLIVAKYGGVQQFLVDSSGAVNASNRVAANGFLDLNGFYSLDASGSDTIALGSGNNLAWSATGLYSGSKDLGLTRAASGILRLSNASTGTGKLVIGNSSNVLTNGLLNVGTAASPSLFVHVNGNVGVGTATPTANLTVAGTASASCFSIDGLTCLSSAVPLSGSQGQVAYFSGTNSAVGTSSLFIASSGNVGIGTTTPKARLDVGNGKIVGGTFSGTPSRLNTLDLSAESGQSSSVFTMAQGGQFKLIESGGNGDLSLQLYATNPSARAYIHSYNESELYIQTQNVSPIIFRPFTTEAMRMVYGGAGVPAKVSLGSSTPYGQLAIQPNSSQTFPPLLVGSITNATAFVVTYNGNVGVGTVAPMSRLAVVGNSYTSGTATAACFTTDGSTCLSSGSTVTGSQGQVAYFSGANTAVGTSTLFIASSSNVGIGTTTPYQPLMVADSGGNALALQPSNTTIYAYGNGSNVSLTLQPKGVSPVYTMNGVSDNVTYWMKTNSFRPGYADFRNTTDSGGVGVRGTNLQATGNFELGDNAAGGTLGYSGSLVSLLLTNNTSFKIGTASADILRITSGGNVGIGTTTPTQLFVVGTNTGNALAFNAAPGRLGVGTINPSYKVEIVDTTSGSPPLSVTDNTGSCTYSNIDGGYNCTSDARLKTATGNYDNVLSKLDNFQAVNFNWLSTGMSTFGVIAQDLQRSFPELVKVGETPDDYLSVSYGKFGVVAMQGLKELSEKTLPLAEALRTVAPKFEGLDVLLGNEQTLVERLQSIESRLAALEKKMDGQMIANLAASRAVTVLGEVEIGGKLYVSSEISGVVSMPAGTTSVEVHFASPFRNVPTVTVTPKSFVGSYRVTGETETGFVVEVEKVQTEAAHFVWIALGSGVSQATPDSTTNRDAQGREYGFGSAEPVAVTETVTEDTEEDPHSGN